MATDYTDYTDGPAECLALQPLFQSVRVIRGHLQRNLVVPHLTVEIVEQRHSAIRNHSAIEWLAREPADRFKRLPKRDDDDLDFVVNVALKEHGITEAIELFQLGENGRLKVLCVMRSLVAAGPRRPVSCDH